MSSMDMTPTRDSSPSAYVYITYYKIVSTVIFGIKLYNVQHTWKMYCGLNSSVALGAARYTTSVDPLAALKSDSNCDVLRAKQLPIYMYGTNISMYILQIGDIRYWQIMYQPGSAGHLPPHGAVDLYAVAVAAHVVVVVVLGREHVLLLQRGGLDDVLQPEHAVLDELVVPVLVVLAGQDVLQVGVAVLGPAAVKCCCRCYAGTCTMMLFVSALAAAGCC